ncbi:MAG: hypothetical protein H6624_04635 [Bdellovibrionaceae bacterium]|nr:hypothetical protein [Pseudobdellovibrionaceae bacterium]
MDEGDNLISEIQQIIIQYKQEVTGGRKAWPKAVKDRVKKLWKLGYSSHELSKIIGVPYVTLNAWEKAAPGRFKPVKIRDQKAVPTAALTVKSSTVEPLTVEGLTVVTPQGYQIKGLSFSQVRQLIHGVM